MGAEGASGGVDGNQKWVIGPVSSVRTRRTRKTRAPAESLPKILMQAGLQKRIATTNKHAQRRPLRVGNIRKLSEQSPQQLDVSVPVCPFSAPIKPHHGGITAAYYAFPASPSFRRVNCQRTWSASLILVLHATHRPTNRHTEPVRFETELGEGNEKRETNLSCRSLPSRAMYTAFGSLVYKRESCIEYPDHNIPI